MKSIKGLIMAILSSATFGLIPLFSIPLMENDDTALVLDLDNVCFYRFLFSALLMGIIVFAEMARRRGWKNLGAAAADAFGISAKQFLLLLMISVFYASTSIFLTASYTIGEIPSGIATTMHFLYPVFVTAIMILFFGEKISFAQNRRMGQKDGLPYFT